MKSKRAILIGGSVAALAAALVLIPRGWHVICIEKDSHGLPDSHQNAWERWRRRGAGQNRHSHVFLSPLVQHLKTQHREFFDSLINSGASELTFREMVRLNFPNGKLLAEDDAISFLACRRLIFEYLLRRHAERFAVPGGMLTFLTGRTVTGVSRRLESVSGVILDGKETVEGDVIIDASGRHTQSSKWLVKAGFSSPRIETHPCGIFYASRSFKLRDGVDYPSVEGGTSLQGGALGVDLGYLKIAIFRCDNRTFSLTLAANPEDKALLGLTRLDAFQRATSQLAETKNWVDPSRSNPISRVLLSNNLSNCRRRIETTTKPYIPNWFAVGDAQIHTNPLAGRGCTLAWMMAKQLAEILDTQHEPHERALEFERYLQSTVVPWYRLQVAHDYQSIAVSRALKDEDSSALSMTGENETHLRAMMFRHAFRVAATQTYFVLYSVKSTCLVNRILLHRTRRW